MFDSVESAILSATSDATAMGGVIVAAVLTLTIGLKLIKKVANRAS